MSAGTLTVPPDLSPKFDGKRRFADLRSVQWRVDLGVLPSSPSALTDELRRVTADSRRRYAALRRRLLRDPHTSMDGSNSPDLTLDNPLSQNPESSWGRFFRNAELEKMVDQDLLRLYPEDGSYFQTPGCQGMLRRILLLWCLKHPDHGYRQGMHELLAPLIYVLQDDINRLSQVRELYEDHFTDKFDELSVHESDFTYNFDYRRFSNSWEDPTSVHGSTVKARSLDDLDPEVQKIVLLSDPYGAEGELGILLSEKFMEHDAYSMFESLMSGVNGSVAMADFFSNLSVDGTKNSSPPVIEASAALYCLLSVVDLPLHTHLTELGVEPQYFCLRWLRVLFGREFALLDLLVIWDEIFVQDNSKIDSQDVDSFNIFGSARGAFIAAMATSMILHLRPSLLGAELATSALQRLLSFPQNVDLKKLIQKAKTLQALVLEAPNSFLTSPLVVGAFEQRKPVVRGHSLSSDSVSPKSPLSFVPDSYWEERWRVLHKEEEKMERGSLEKHASVPTRKRGWTEKVRASLIRAGSDPSPAKSKHVRNVPARPVRRSLLEDLSRQLGFDEGVEDIVPGDENYSSENSGSEDDPLVSFDSSSSHCETIDSEKSISQPEQHEDYQQFTAGDSSLSVSNVSGATSSLKSSNEDSMDNLQKDLKEQKPLFGKFQWFWKFGRGHASEVSANEGDSIEAPKPPNPEENLNIDTLNVTKPSPSATDENHEPPATSKADAPEPKVMGTFKNLGQTMLEHVQVLESAFQQDRGQVGSLESFSKNVLVGKGQVTAMAALKELRKISNLLSEM